MESSKKQHILLGILLAGIQMAPNKNNSFHYSLFGIGICRKAFLCITSSNNHQLNTLSQQFRDNMLFLNCNIPSIKLHRGRSKGTGVKEKELIDFMVDFGKANGTSNREMYMLPPNFTKTMVYEAYEVHIKQRSHRPLSKGYFFRLWNTKGIPISFQTVENNMVSEMAIL